MGKIKSKAIKKAAVSLINNEDIELADNFEDNKKILGNTMPSKKMRNQLAGYIAKLKKREKAQIK